MRLAVVHGKSQPLAAGQIVQMVAAALALHQHAFAFGEKFAIHELVDGSEVLPGTAPRGFPAGHDLFEPTRVGQALAHDRHTESLRNVAFDGGELVAQLPRKRAKAGLEGGMQLRHRARAGQGVGIQKAAQDHGVPGIETLGKAIEDRGVVLAHQHRMRSSESTQGVAYSSNDRIDLSPPRMGPVAGGLSAVARQSPIGFLGKRGKGNVPQPDLPSRGTLSLV